MHNPIVNGLFYPDDKRTLGLAIDHLIDSAKNEPSDSIAIISPHAGLKYSGKYAGEAFNSVRLRKIKTVIVAGPVHREFSDSLYLPESSRFRTIEGKVDIDVDFINNVGKNCHQIERSNIPYYEEHSIEMQLIFIKHLFPDAGVVPILCGSPSGSNIKDMKKIFDYGLKNLEDEILIVISSNLSAYLPFDKAKMDSEKSLEYIREKNWKTLMDRYRKKKITMCGAACISAFLKSANSRVDARIINTGTSNLIFKNNDSCVFYGSVSFNLKQKGLANE